MRQQRTGLTCLEKSDQNANVAARGLGVRAGVVSGRHPDYRRVVFGRVECISCCFSLVKVGAVALHKGLLNMFDHTTHKEQNLWDEGTDQYLRTSLRSATKRNGRDRSFFNWPSATEG